MTEQRSRLTAREVRRCLSLLCNSEELFSLLYERLEVRYFEGYELYHTLYRVVLDYYTVHLELPGPGVIWAECEAELDKMPGHFTDSETEELDSLLHDIYNNPDRVWSGVVEDRQQIRWAIDKVREFIEERLVSEHLTALSADLLPEDLPDVLSNVQRHVDDIRNISSNTGVELTFSGDWDKAASRAIRTTGLSYLDDFMGGGHAPGEVYGILAPYGTCKTTLATMLTCNDARYAQQSRDPQEADSYGLSVLVSYEAPKQPELLQRFLMYMAQVRRDSLESMGSDGLASLGQDAGKPRPYEKDLFYQHLQDQMFMPEVERVAQCVDVLNQHSLVLDMTGADPDNRQAGGGGIKEIRQRIHAELVKRGPECYITSVVVDYVGALVKRQLADANLDNSELRHHITQLPLFATTLLAKEFSCPVWLVHQLSGQANSMLKPGAALHHTDSAESKSFGENLDFAFVLGNLNSDNMGQIACTKHRRSGELPPKVIQVDGMFNTVLARDDMFMDTSSRLIVDRDTASTVGVVSAVATTSSVDFSADSMILDDTEMPWDVEENESNNGDDQASTE